MTKQDGIGGALTSINNDLTSLNSNLTINNLYSGDDLNTKLGYNGLRVFYVGSGVTNSPQDYAVLLVIGRGGSGLASQMSIGNEVFSRVYIGSPPAWNEWKKLS